MSTNIIQRLAVALPGAVLLVVVAICQPLSRTAGQATANADVNPPVKPGLDSSYSSCFDATNGKSVGSQTVRTRTLVTLDGRYRAYAESTSLGSPGSVPQCSNTSRLLVAGSEKSPFRVVLTVKPTEELHGNDMQLIDWSPKGHVLLFSQGQWEWGSDFGAEDARTYDARSGLISHQALVADALSKHFARRCAAVFEAQGFSADSKVIVIAKPWFDVGDDTPAKESCSDKVGRWSIDFATGEINSVEDTYKVEHRGNLLARNVAP